MDRGLSSIASPAARARALALVATLLLAGCGAPSAARPDDAARVLRGEAGLEADDDAPRFALPGLEVPEPPSSVDVDDPALEPILRLSEALLTRARAEPDPTANGERAASSQIDRYGPWIGSIASGIRDLWHALERLETRQLGVHVVACAVVGGTLRAVASRIDELPAPPSVDTDELRETFRDALHGVTEPIRDRATQALGVCASEAVGSADPSLDEWRRWCDDANPRGVTRAASGVR